VPVPLEVVTTWRTVAITAAAVDRGSSLDLTALAASGATAALSLANKVSALRVVKSHSNLQSLLAPPAPAPRPPPFAVASPSVSSLGSPRCASQLLAPGPLRRLRALPVSPTGLSGGGTPMRPLATAGPGLVARFHRNRSPRQGLRVRAFHPF
jgi:hypothetical protein